MTNSATLDLDPDVLWIRLRSALREGRIADAADAQKRLAEGGIVVQIDRLEARRSSQEAARAS